MRDVIKLCDKILDALTNAASWVAGSCMLLTAFIIVYEIIMRSIFSSPTEWVLEVSVYLILVAGFLGLAVTYRHNGHVRVELLLARLGKKQQCVLDAVTTFLGIMFFFVFMTESMDVVLTSLEFSRMSPSILRVPLWIPQMSLVCGGFLILMQMIRTLCMDIYQLKSGIDFEEGQGE